MLDLMYVATAGFKPGTQEPSESGMCRLRRAYEEALAGHVKAIIVIGGRRKNGPSEAETYFEYAREHMPELAERVIIVDAQATCTNRDLLMVDDKVADYMQMVGLSHDDAVAGVTSYDQHMERMEMVLQALGFKNVILCDSGETGLYPKYREFIMTEITRRDPFWEGLIGKRLVWWADRRLNLVAE